jgi:peroxiredoxin
MLTIANRFPVFDLSEIIQETEFSYKTVQPLKPVKTGGVIPDFVLHQDGDLWRRFNNGGETQESLLWKDLLNKPLVISFYSAHWRSVGIKQLNQLNTIQPEVRANGGNLLVITAERNNELAKVAWDHNLSLSFYFDDNNEIAKKFNVYSENDPAWSKFSGVENNIPLPATYVISAAKRIIYDHVDITSFGTFSSRQVVSAVHGTALFQ